MNLFVVSAQIFGIGSYAGMAAIALLDPTSPTSLKTAGTLALFWGASAAVQSLPAPDATSSNLYRFAYKFANVLGANLLHANVSTPSTDLVAHIAPANVITDAADAIVKKELAK
jgi:hypothetical protein